ncbi:hypothetical protein O6H91_12G070500 [Diphasiastrum complanatum]|uniref:Uncharacterized protein n=1 Tax=Diphasiastrum complanatum TaxID=34168 RepID=A0ACC2C3B0_DIPCM|nr:hypothetical protein O6H91_12G070500 [Diphasiastrum complanatum]
MHQLIGYTMQLWFWKHFIFHSLCMWLILVAHASNGEPLGLKLIHKFSDEARALLQHRSGGKLEPWPSKGSMDFYRMLHNHDRGRHERKLSTNGEVTFSKGMETAQLADQFGWLYYTLVDVGTPNKTFLVALDTGSDLFWVPCQCKQCAPRSAPGYPNLVQFLNVYSPAESVTSKPVSCSNSLCDLSNSCVSGTDQCPYSIQYLSTNTSTSGTLVEDIMYFSSRDPSKAPLLQVSVIFGYIFPFALQFRLEKVVRRLAVTVHLKNWCLRNVK